MERAVRFVVGFLCHPDGLDDVKVELAEEVLRFLTARSMALNKAVRFRTCQLTVVRHHSRHDLPVTVVVPAWVVAAALRRRPASCIFHPSALTLPRQRIEEELSVLLKKRRGSAASLCN